MKILTISTDFPYKDANGVITQGGGGACIAQLLGELHKRGYEIGLVTRVEKDLVDEIYDFPIYRTKSYNLGFRESKATHYFTIKKKAKELAKGFDLVHTHNPLAGLTGCKVGLPHVLTMHGSWSSVRQRAYTRMVARWMEKKAVNKADIVTCDSHALEEEMCVRYSPKETITIPNAIDTMTFTPYIPNIVARRKLGLDGETNLVLYTGRFVEEKGLPYLLEAFKDVKDANLLLVGGGFDEHLVTSWFKKNLDMRDRIKVLPYLPYEKMVLAYSACNIFVLPSFSEGMSRSIMEAMACGKPIVATDVGGNPELVNDDTGILIQPKNSSQIAEAINRLLKDPISGRIMGKKGREFIENKLTVNRRVNAFEKVYYKLFKK